MKALRLAVICTAIAILVCIWLLVHAVWYTVVLFMLVAQPLLLLGAALFMWAVLRDLCRRGAL